MNQILRTIRQGLFAVVAVMAIAGTLHAGAIHEAAGGGRIDELKQLLKNDPALIESRDAGQATPLYRAAISGKTDAVRLLIARGADVNARTPDGLTSIHWAALHGDAKIVEMLIAAGTGIDEKSTVQENTPLIETWSGNRAEVAETLLRGGANVNAAENRYGWTTLHFAAYRCHRELMSVLLSHNANVNLRDNQGRTALHMAALNGCPATVKMLLDAGANTGARDVGGKTAAELSEDAQIAQMIALYGSSGKTLPIPPAAGCCPDDATIR